MPGAGRVSACPTTVPSAVEPTGGAGCDQLRRTRQRPLHRQAVDRLHRSPARPGTPSPACCRASRPRRPRRPGLNLGIEFRGGSEFRVSGVADTSDYESRAQDAVGAIRRRARPGHQASATSTVRVQTERLSDDREPTVQAALARRSASEPTTVSASFVGPSWGASVSQKALQGLVVFLVLVALVMAVYFRTWKMAVAGLVALLHDLVITVGIYALVGFEVTPATMIGFLTILGYSLYDTVVVFDKVRENTTEALGNGRLTYSAGGQPRGQPDPGAVDQHHGRGAAADRGDPLRRVRSSSARARCSTSPWPCSSVSRRRLLVDLHRDAAAGGPAPARARGRRAGEEGDALPGAPRRQVVVGRRRRAGPARGRTPRSWPLRAPTPLTSGRDAAGRRRPRDAQVRARAARATSPSAHPKSVAEAARR